MNIIPLVLSVPEINDKIIYWVDLWEELIDNFGKEAYGLELANPHLTIMDIIDEIEFNHLQNSDNKNYFLRQLKKLFDSDPILKGKYKTDFNLILSELNKYDGNAYFPHLCKSIENIFHSGSYFEELHKKLMEILLKPCWEKDDKENIKTITQYLIVEFMLKGYSLKTIKSFPKNLFDKYRFYEDDIIHTYYPCNTEWENFRQDAFFDKASYKQAIVEEIDRLTISDRLSQLLKYYHPKIHNHYFIFQIDGLKGDVDLNIGIVNFYSIKNKKYIIETIQENDIPEYFGANEKDRRLLNAAVQIQYIDLEIAKLSAIQIIERALDILRLYYHSEIDIRIAVESCLVVDFDGKQIGDYWSLPKFDPRWRDIRALNLSDIPPDKVFGSDFLEGKCKSLFVSLEEQSNLEQNIIRSIRWYRKGEEAGILEDRLLDYWIAIENILNFKDSILNPIFSKDNQNKESAYTLARKFLPSIETMKFIFDVGHGLYHGLYHKLHSPTERGILELTQDVIEKCVLNCKPGDTIDLRTFINNLPLLLDMINQNVIKRKIDESKILFAHKFYNDNCFAKNEINKMSNQVQDDILLIYRYRNKIVHNAHFDNTILPYYIEKTQKYAGDLLRTVLDGYSKGFDKTEDIFLNSYVKTKRLMQKLEQNVEVDFLNLDF